MKDPSPSHLADIEPADEAGEIKSSPPLSPPPSSVDEQKSDRLIANNLQPRAHGPELDVFKHTLGGEEPIHGAPMVDPLRRKGNPAPCDDWRQFSKELNKLGVIQ